MKNFKIQFMLVAGFSVALVASAGQDSNEAPEGNQNVQVGQGSTPTVASESFDGLNSSQILGEGSTPVVNQSISMVQDLSAKFMKRKAEFNKKLHSGIEETSNNVQKLVTAKSDEVITKGKKALGEISKEASGALNKAVEFGKQTKNNVVEAAGQGFDAAKTKANAVVDSAKNKIDEFTAAREAKLAEEKRIADEQAAQLAVAQAEASKNTQTPTEKTVTSTNSQTAGVAKDSKVAEKPSFMNSAVQFLHNYRWTVGTVSLMTVGAVSLYLYQQYNNEDQDDTDEEENN